MDTEGLRAFETFYMDFILPTFIWVGTPSELRTFLGVIGIRNMSR